MKAHDLCSAFTQQVLAAVGHKLSEEDLTAAQLTAIDDWWMPFLFKLREEWHRKQIVAGRASKSKAVSA
jgi:hypothetical protein